MRRCLGGCSNHPKKEDAMKITKKDLYKAVGGGCLLFGYLWGLYLIAIAILKHVAISL